MLEAVPTIINSSGVIFSLTDNAELFASIFASNQILDDKGDLLTKFSRITKQILRILITVSEISRLNERLDLDKTFDPNNIPGVVLKSMNSELSPC